MTPLTRRVTAFTAAFALVQAMAAPLLGGCERTHETVAAASPLMTTLDQSSSHGSSHTECPESDVPSGQTRHSEECQQSCVSMLGCTTLSFVVAVALFEVPNGSAMTPTPAVLVLPNRSLTPESPPPKA